jgi:HSP20 family molecular chaperone IbpA
METITKTESQKTPERGRKETLPEVAPAVDVYENDNEFLVIADLPGVGQDGADVTLDNDRLVLSAETAARRYVREFVVPPSVDAEQVSATVKAGVLSVHLPKRAPYKPRQIQVKTA